MAARHFPPLHLEATKRNGVERGRAKQIDLSNARRSAKSHLVATLIRLPLVGRKEKWGPSK